MNQVSRIVLSTTFILYLLTGCASEQLRGRLKYNDIEIDKVTAVQPHFWFRSEDKGTSVTPLVKYNNGLVKIYSLPLGNYGMSVNIDANPENPKMYPGDYKSWTKFTVTEGHRSDLDIELLKTLHLTSPQDNVVFSWDVLENDVYYDYSIALMSCVPFKTLDAIVGGTTKETSISLQLPHSAANEFYLLSLMARKNGRLIGQLMTHGGNGFGWDYRFRVK
jgi:hypothetical protein